MFKANVVVTRPLRSPTFEGIPFLRGRYVDAFARIIIVLAAIRIAFVSRNLPVGSDGLAYLDVARAYLHHDWRLAVNGYWGPLYSWLIAGMDATWIPLVLRLNYLVCWHGNA